MPTDEILIEDPVLDDRAEEDRIAARLHRSVGGLTVADAELGIAYFESLKAMLEATGAVGDPLLPEISSVRPPEAGTVFLTEQERIITETLYRQNLVPNKNRIAFLRLLGTTQLPARPATTTLQFTKTDDFLGVEVVIPEGTEVIDSTRTVRLRTDAELVIAAATASGTVGATNLTEGDVRMPVGAFGFLTEALTGIQTVINTTPLLGGAAAESVDQAKIRAREAMQAGKHLTSATDWENYIFFNTLRRNGRVVAFENYIGNFTQITDRNGYLLLSIQGADGLQPSDALLAQVATVVNLYRVGGISVAVRAPNYKVFDIQAQVRITQGQSATTLINKAKQNLQNFFHPLTFAFGPTYTDRRLSISDVIGQIENASPNGISVRQSDGSLFEVKIIIDEVEYTSDVLLGIGEVPSLQTVTLTPVN